MPSFLDPTRDPVRLGPYTLLERAGAGGMGVVYRARHDATGGVHAVKALLPGAGAEDVLRFMREAEAMAAVEGHPHVLRVHTVGEDAGRLFIGMEWAAGGTLAERLGAGPLPVDEALALARALAAALAHVHARGVLHRDVKPGNVLLDEAGTPRLADFGIARLRGAQALTQSRDVLGTIGYMAPEQATAAATVDERADIFGAAAVVYHALTGRPLRESLGDVLVGRTGPPPRALRPEVPRWLEQVLERAL
ncbi:MAG: serine/threonine protein kinase, partial [Planctomycetota bacterium]|nr:serine/threonine protein kinase [Planctomycetota bacterium]